MTEITVHGIRLAVAPDVISPGIRQRLTEQTYERKELQLVRSMVKKGDRVLELGAGLGLISTAAAQLAGAGRVVCVEANPELIPLIAETHRLNGVTVEVVNGAATLHEAQGTIPFYCRNDFWASSLSPEPWRYKKVMDVPLVALFELFERHRPDVVIADIEGGEAALIGKPWPSHIREVMLELHPKVAGLDQPDVTQAFFVACGFRKVKFHSGKALIHARR